MKLIFRKWPSAPYYVTVWMPPAARPTDCVGSINFEIKHTYPWYSNPGFDALSQEDQEEVDRQVTTFVDDWQALRTVTERLTS